MYRVAVTLKSTSDQRPLLQAISNRLWPADTYFKVMHIMEEPSLFTDIPDDLWERIKNYRTWIRHILREFAFKIERLVPGARAESELIDGPIIDRILKQSESLQVDLIVVGADSPKDPFQAGKGRIAKAIASKAKCSVWIVALK